MRIILLIFIAAFYAGICKAQLVITDVQDATTLAQQLVGPGIVISNVSFTGDLRMTGYFKNIGNLTDINLDSGIVLTTGKAKTVVAAFTPPGLDGDGITQAQATEASRVWNLDGDATLAAAMNVYITDMHDAAVLEFDFIPSGDSIKLKYVFSSEEYSPYYVCNINDGMGFFLSGPGITGQKNIALVPGTNMPVSIFNVNNVPLVGGGCENNPAYYHDNTTNTYFTHDGHTVPLMALAAVQSCRVYHLKLVIADLIDGRLDSGVFLESNSLSSNQSPFLQSVSSIDNCGGNQLSLHFSKPLLCSSIQNTDFSITGPGGPYIITGWQSAACSSGNTSDSNVIITINPSIGSTGNFQVCLTNLSGSVTDSCGHLAPPACFDINIGATTPAFNIPSAICSGSVAPILPATSTNGVSGTWSPSVINNTVSGSYTFTPLAGQCAIPLSITINVTTEILPVFNTIAAICSGSTAPVLPGISLNGISGIWQPAIINNFASGIYIFTPNAGQCADTTSLTVTVTSILTSTTIIPVCQSQLPYSWNGNIYPEAGIYFVTLTGIGGCDSIATLNLTINVLTSSTTIAVCEKQLPYLWNGQSYDTAGQYSITLTGQGGCDSIAVLNLEISPIKFSITNAGICISDLPYIWNGQTYNSAGSYSITLTGSGGCDSVATLNLDVNAVPGPATIISPVLYCQYDITYPLSAGITTAGNQLIWYMSATGGVGSAVPPLPASNIPGSINYYVSQVNGSCEGPREAITVTVNSKPDLGPDKPLKICLGQSGDLNMLYNLAGLTGSWTFNQQPVNNPGAITTAGQYQLIALNDSGCSDTALVDLILYQAITANAGADATIEYNVPYQLSGSGGGQYQWSPSNLLDNPYIANPVTMLTDSATFILMVKDDAGCFDFDTVKLTVLKGPALYVPSTFTPNGDGINDIFRPTAVGIASLDFFRVFNRYGEIVFETHDIGQGWDGTYKGQKQNTGTFVWTIKVKDRKGLVKMMKGNVILIR